MSDLIYRQDTINEVESLLDKTAKGDVGIFYNKILKLAIEHIQKMPSTQQWIPCSERLPEEKERVLVTRKSGFVECIFWSSWWYEQNLYSYLKPIAWMPLPQPWEGE